MNTMERAEVEAFFETLLAQEPATGPLSRPRALSDGTYVMAKPLLFHWTVIRGHVGDSVSYFDRWCFETRELAMAGLEAFPEYPEADFDPPGWHRHPNSGRRRPDGDPAREYVEY